MKFFAECACNRHLRFEKDGFMLTICLFLMLFAVTLIVWRHPHFWEYAFVELPVPARYGINATCSGAFVKAGDPGNRPKEWFHVRTLILGTDNNGVSGHSTATFTFDLPRNIRTGAVQTYAYLMIKTERIHGGLHSHLGPRMKKATIEANGERIDECWLIEKMPYGEDYGFHDLGPIPIDLKFLCGKKLKLVLTIEDQMWCDIDLVELHIQVGSTRPTVMGSMLLGALLSSLIGLMPLAIESIFALLKSQS